jgi:Arm DNA-binding domain
MPILPTEANLRRARQQLERIKRSIANGTFSFAEEFPDFRDLKKVLAEGCPRTCSEVFDLFLAHCQSRVKKGDLATVTVATYRRVLNGIWRPQIGNFRLLDVRHSTLVKIADEPDWSKKTYNNAISVLRRAFTLGFRATADRTARDKETSRFVREGQCDPSPMRRRQPVVCRSISHAPLRAVAYLAVRFRKIHSTGRWISDNR